MIFTERTITVVNDSATINKPLILYRGDKNIELKITIAESQFKFRNTDASNVIETTDASYAQLVINTPYNSPIFSDVAATKNGAVIFVITEAMIDEIREVGAYEIQIRLLDDNKQSRASIPPVSNAIEIREPIAIEDGSAVDSNAVNVAKVNHALTTTSAPLEVFDSQGNYIKKTWGDGDPITDAALNKMEAAIDGVNKKIGNNRSQIKEIDAELIDARIGTDGTVYPNLGNSIRTQITNINDYLFNFEENPNIFLDNSYTDGKCISNWGVGSTTYNDLYDTNERTTSAILKIKENTSYIFLQSDGSMFGTINGYGIYDKNGVSLYYGTGGKTEIVENQAYIRFSLQPLNKNYMVNIQPYDNHKGDNGYTIYPMTKYLTTTKFVEKEDGKGLSSNDFTDSYKSELDKLIEKSMDEKPTILFIFDNSSYNNKSAILESHNFCGTFAIGPDSLSTADIKTLIKKGNDIGMYGGSGTRPSSYVDPSLKNDWRDYIKKGLEIFNSNGMYLPTFYGCPNHKTSNILNEVLTELGFKYVSASYTMVDADTWDDPSTVFNNVYENKNTNTVLSPFTMINKDFDTIKLAIDKAVEGNYALPLFTHEVVDTNPGDLNITTEIFTQVVNYVSELKNAGKVDVLTMREYFNKYNKDEGYKRDYTRIMSAIVDRV